MLLCNMVCVCVCQVTPEEFRVFSPNTTGNSEEQQRQDLGWQHWK